MNFRRFLKQTCVIYPATGRDPYGNETHGSGVQAICRWEGKTQVITLPSKKEYVSTAHVLLVTPLVVGSYVYKGTLAAAPAAPSPSTADGCWMVMSVGETPDLKAKNTLYTAYL